jgi:broad specificity phosphatase PhoE
MKLNNKYYLLRHGQTIHQLKKPDFIYPRPDSSKIRLTKKGKEQIKKSVSRLKGTKVDFIYSSDFYRTKQTAEIAASILGAKLLFDKRLRDLNLGIYHGKRKEEFYRDFPKNSKKRFAKVPPEGESWALCQKRMLDFFKEINKKHKGKTILIVSHGDPLWLLEGGVKGFSQAEILKYKEKNYMDFGELKKL